jgi:2-hydroxy-3-keto-5-methylthiopentenyl-1-phosphate phosphatase
MAPPAATVFCDFDGTITAEDTFDAVAAAVVPQVWWPLKERLFNFELNLRDAMASLASALSPADLAAMVEHMGEFEPRPGFLPFLDALDAAGLPFVLVSGGLVPLVEKVLGPHRHRLEQLVAATVQPHPTPNQGLEFHSPFRSSEELVAKAEVMERYGQGLRVVIGDSITDLRMAEAADLVFARAPLCDWLDQRGIAYHRWDDFDDVAAVLRAEGLLPAVAA